jgi:hypothetical protein
VEAASHPLRQSFRLLLTLPAGCNGRPYCPLEFPPPRLIPSFTPTAVPLPFLLNGGGGGGSLFLAGMRNDSDGTAAAQGALNRLSASFASTHLYNYNNAPAAVPTPPKLLAPSPASPHAPARARQGLDSRRPRRPLPAPPASSASPARCTLTTQPRQPSQPPPFPPGYRPAPPARRLDRPFPRGRRCWSTTSQPTGPTTSRPVTAPPLPIPTAALLHARPPALRPGRPAIHVPPCIPAFTTPHRPAIRRGWDWLLGGGVEHQSAPAPAPSRQLRAGLFARSPVSAPCRSHRVPPPPGWRRRPRSAATFQPADWAGPREALSHTRARTRARTRTRTLADKPTHMHMVGAQGHCGTLGWGRCGTLAT